MKIKGSVKAVFKLDETIKDKSEEHFIECDITPEFELKLHLMEILNNEVKRLYRNLLTSQKKGVYYEFVDR